MLTTIFDLKFKQNTGLSEEQRRACPECDSTYICTNVQPVHSNSHQNGRLKLLASFFFKYF